MKKYVCVSDKDGSRNEFDNRDDCIKWLENEGGGSIEVYVWMPDFPNGEWVYQTKEYINSVQMETKVESFK